jgi:hypothetical protein
MSRRRPPSRPKLRMLEVTLRRKYRSAAKAAPVILELGRARRVVGWGWAVPVRLVGLDLEGEAPRPIFGMDGLQATHLALEYARLRLRASGLEFYWLEPNDDLGLPQSIARMLPYRTRRRLETLLDQAVTRWASAQARRARALDRRAA